MTVKKRIAYSIGTELVGDSMQRSTRSLPKNNEVTKTLVCEPFTLEALAVFIGTTSGGNEPGDVVVVGGVIYGDRKTEYLLDEFEEITGEKKERYEHYKVYHFGLATGIADLRDTCAASVKRDRPDLEF